MLRQVFAQHRDHEVSQNPNVNAIPIFDGHKTLLRVKARQTDDEEANRMFIMPLTCEGRYSDGSIAVVHSLTVFKRIPPSFPNLPSSI